MRWLGRSTERRSAEDPNAARLLERLRQENRRLRLEVTALHGLRDAAYRDALTGLRNRRYLDERLREEVTRGQRQRGREGSLLLCDLNGFKRLNDAFGHGVGDAVLVEVARLIESTLRLEDVCCRTGGDEFTIVLPDTGGEGALRAAARLRAALARRNVEATHAIDAAVGVATWPADGTSPDALLQAADQAMYADKARSATAARDGAVRARLQPV